MDEASATSFNVVTRDNNVNYFVGGTGDKPLIAARSSKGLSQTRELDSTGLKAVILWDGKVYAAVWRSL